MVRSQRRPHVTHNSNCPQSTRRSIEEVFLLVDPPSPSFCYYPAPVKAKFKKAAIEIAAGQKYTIFKVDDQQGMFHYFAINLEDDDDLVLKIEVDGEAILNHSVDDIVATGANRLGLEVTKAASGFLNVIRDDALNAVIVFNCVGGHVPWRRKCIISVKNRGSAAFDIQSYYLLYHECYPA